MYQYSAPFCGWMSDPLHGWTIISTCSSADDCYCLVAKLYLALCDPMDCSSPGSSVHGISQAKILEWVAISVSRGSSRPRDQIRLSYSGRCFFFFFFLTMEPPGSLKMYHIFSIYSSTDDGHLYYFHLLALRNHAAADIHCKFCVAVCLHFFYLGVLLGPMANLCLIF